MKSPIPNIIIDSPKPLRLKDKVVGENEHGVIMDISENEMNIEMVCVNCKYFVRRLCKLPVLCIQAVGDYQYYK
jgi:hypothetical protein